MPEKFEILKNKQNDRVSDSEGENQILDVDKYEQEIYQEQLKEILDQVDLNNFDFDLLKNIPIVFHEDIFIKLIGAKKSLVVLDNLEKFNINYQGVVKYFINKGLAGIFIENMKRFKNLDHSNVAQQLIDGDLIYILVDNINFFNSLSQNVLNQIVEKGSTSEVNVVFHRLDYFKINPEVELKYSGSKTELSTFYLNQQNIKGLYSLILATSEKEREGLFEGLNIDFEKILFKYVSSGDIESSYWLINSLKLFNYKKYKDIITRFELKINTDLLEIKKEDINRDPYKEIELENEMINFYALQFLLIDVKFKEHELNKKHNNEEFFFRDKVYLNDLRLRIEKKVEELFNFVKQYLILAVNSELNNQDQVLDMAGAVFIPQRFEGDCLRFIRQGTAEEIRIYLSNAQKRFLMDFTKSFGGSNWSNISKLGFEVWKEENQKEKKDYSRKNILIDMVFQLQHNYGVVFNKDEDRIFYESDNIKNILDSKFNAKSFQEFADSVEDYAGDIAVEKIEIIKKDIENIKKIRFISKTD